jgi:hypothetical protein
MTTMQTNGKLRKSLAEQIDRLDGILDGLANALNESVAAAVKDAVGAAVREAVQAVMTEVLTNPAVLELLHGGVAVPAVRPGRTTGSRVGGWVRTASAAAGAQVRATVGVFAVAAKAVRGGVAACWARLSLVRRLKLDVLTAAGVGVLAAMAAYHAGPWLASTATGLGSFTAALAVQLLVRVRTLLSGTFCGHA